MPLSSDFTIIGMTAVGVTKRSGLNVISVKEESPDRAIGNLKDLFDPSRNIVFRPIVRHEPTGQEFVHQHVSPDGARDATAVSDASELFSNISANRIAKETELPVLVSKDGPRTYGAGSGLLVVQAGKDPKPFVAP